jgi:hypothetical protein
MSEHEELVGWLHLVGYEKLTDHGLALPVFGQSQGANVFYTARSTSPGGANGQIAGFDHYDPGGLVHLPLVQIRETGIGEPWLDVFLWEGAAYVGTAAEIWNALGELHESIAEHAPLSLLALAEGVDPVHDLKFVQKAFSWLTTRYGRQKAGEWLNVIYLRGMILKSVRRELGANAERAALRRALQEEIVVHNNGNKVSIFIGSRFSFLDRASLDAIAGVAASFDVKAEFIIQQVHVMPSLKPLVRQDAVVRRRTTENEMRIAALQVAASKPDGKARTTELKSEVDRYLALTTEDRTPSRTRPNEAIYQQIIGNIVSHRGSKTNIFAKGWAIYTGDGIQITDAGRQHLRTLRLPG